MFKRQMRFLLLLLLPFSSMVIAAGGVFERVTGDVTLDGVTIESGDYFESGATVNTGADSTVVMEYDDGQITLLIDNTQLVVEDYVFDELQPQDSTSVLNLLAGGMRFVSGTISKSRRDAVQIKTPTAVIGIRGTEFNLVIGSLAVQMISGSTNVANAGGSAQFGPSQIGYTSSVNTAMAPTSFGSLPSAIQASLVSLNNIALAVGLGSVVVESAAVGANIGGIAGVSGLAGVGIAGALIAAAVVIDDNSSDDAEGEATSTTSTTSSTGN